MTLGRDWRGWSRSRAARRLVFFGVNLLVLGLAYLVFIDPARRLIAARAEAIAGRLETLARYEAVVAHAPQIQDYARQVAETNARGELFDGDTEGVIDANLQARLKTIAEEAQVTVRSIQMLPEKPFQGVTLVGARLDVAGNYENIHTLARLLEGAPPLLVITAATLRANTPIWGAPTPSGQTIEAQFNVFGGAARKKSR